MLVKPPSFSPKFIKQEVRRAAIAYSSYRFLRNLNFNFSLTTAFYLSHGISFSWFVALDGLYFITKLLTEALNGQLADRFGRRAISIASCLTFTTALWSVLFYPNIGGFIFSQILLGYAQGIQRPVPAAHYYDWLKSIGYQPVYKRIERLGQSFTNIAQALSTAAGSGAARLWGLNSVWIATGIVGLMAIFPILHFPKKITIGTFEQVSFAQSIYQTFNRVIKNNRIRQLSIKSSVVFSSTRLAFWLLQVSIIKNGYNLIWCGIATFFVYAIAAISARWIITPHMKIGKLGLLSIILYLFLLFFSNSHGYNGFILLSTIVSLLGLIYGLLQPIILISANELIEGQDRATSLAIISSFSSIIHITLCSIIAIFSNIFTDSVNVTSCAVLILLVSSSIVYR